MYADRRKNSSFNSTASENEMHELEKEYARINRYLHEKGLDADPLKDYESILAARETLYKSHGFS